MDSPLLKPVPTGRPSMFDVPRCSDLDILDADLAVVGVPFSVPLRSLSLHDVQHGSQAIRGNPCDSPRAISATTISTSAAICSPGRRVEMVDCGDVATTPSTIQENPGRVTAVIRKILERGAVPIVLGGEHSIPIPVMRAYEGHGPIHIVHVDAHLDWRDEIGGVKDGLSSPLRRASEMPWFSGMTQIGLRGFGSARKEEFDAARAYGSILVGAEELHRVGIDEILRRIPASERYYITIDADGLDPTIAPGVAGPAPGGVTYSQVTNLIRGVAAKGKVVGYDFVEVVPSADVGNITSYLAGRLILTLLGALCHTGQIGK